MSFSNNIMNGFLNTMERYSSSPIVRTILQVLAISSAIQRTGWPASYNIKNGEKFDFIVVGAGSAGAIIAARLSEVQNIRVLLLEAGGNPPANSVIPSLFATLAHTPSDWDYHAYYDPGVGLAHPGGVQFLTRGKMLGGCSSNNYQIYSRGVPQDYDEWSYTAPGWDWHNVLPYFKKSENMTDYSVFQNPNNAYLHSTEGPLKVSRPKANEVFQEKDRLFLQSLKEIGIPTILEINGPEIVGASKPHFTFADGRRSSTAEAFLRPTKDRPNLKVAKFTRATKILIDPSTNRAYGVESIQSEKKVKVYSTNEVIVSAGTVDSPKLLMLSGIGPVEELGKHNIQVIADLPVGYNYHDHQTVNLAFTGEKGLQTGVSNLLALQELDAYPAPIQTGFFKFDNFSHELKPDIQLFNVHMGAGLSAANFIGCRSVINLDERYCYSIANANLLSEMEMTSIILLHPKSRGQVKLKSSNPLDDPIIENGFLRSEEDVDALVKAIKYMSRLLDTTHFRKVKGRIVKADVTGCDGLKRGTDEYWSCYVKNTVTSLLHPVGTCHMGPEGVVDENLKVHGISGLRVADASVMPKTVSGNTNAPAMMIGERAADLIKQDYNLQQDQFKNNYVNDPFYYF